MTKDLDWDCFPKHLRPSKPPEKEESPPEEPLSQEALAALEAGIESGKKQPPVYRGSFAQYDED